MFSPLLPAQHNQGRKHKGLIAFLKNETPPLTCLHLRTLSEQRQVAPIHLFPLLPQSHVRCFSLAEDAGVGKCSPESCVLTGEDLRHFAQEQGSGEGTGGWHTMRTTTGLTSFEQCLGSFHQVNVCALNSCKKITWLSTTAEFGFRPAKLIPSATSEGSVSLGASQRGERLRGNQTADNPEEKRCGDTLYFYAKKHLTLLKVAANLGTGRRQIAVLVTK